MKGRRCTPTNLVLLCVTVQLGDSSRASHWPWGRNQLPHWQRLSCEYHCRPKLLGEFYTITPELLILLVDLFFCCFWIHPPYLSFFFFPPSLCTLVADTPGQLHTGEEYSIWGTGEEGNSAAGCSWCSRGTIHSTYHMICMMLLWNSICTTIFGFEVPSM